MKPGDSDQYISHLFKKHRTELTHPMPNHLKSKIINDLFPKPKERVFLLSWMSFGGGALATCVALVMTFQLGRISGNGASDQALTEEVVSSHVRSLMANHLSDVVSTDQHTVKPWFEGKIDFGPSVKDFSKDGFPLVGGRLDYIEGRPTAALVYRFNQHIINVFQHPAPVSESSEPRLKTLRGYQVFSWTKDGMIYWVVSDVNAADLQKFVYHWL
jgi:anti-sigma factor RsiW